MMNKIAFNKMNGKIRRIHSEDNRFYYCKINNRRMLEFLKSSKDVEFHDILMEEIRDVYSKCRKLYISTDNYEDVIISDPYFRKVRYAMNNGHSVKLEYFISKSNELIVYDIVVS